MSSYKQILILHSYVEDLEVSTIYLSFNCEVAISMFLFLIMTSLALPTHRFDVELHAGLKIKAAEYLRSVSKCLTTKSGLCKVQAHALFFFFFLGCDEDYYFLFFYS